MPRQAARTHQQLAQQQHHHYHQPLERQDQAQPPQLEDKCRRRHPRRTSVPRGQKQGRPGRRLGQQLEQQRRRHMRKAQTPCQQGHRQER
ncbi:hypothetical protein PG997_010955 [Apiospora hydei]|uniref:Uncharacterized protein n=1 Tax=Apiospora hydei TaxID=1337664 RepID=A0ABR1VHX6_9PEZI